MTAVRPKGPFQTASINKKREEDSTKILLGLIIASLLEPEAPEIEPTAAEENTGFFSGLFSFLKNIFMPGAPERDLTMTEAARKFIPVSGPSVLDPDLLKRMQTDPRVHAFVNYTIQKGDTAGLDGVLMANQFWQESRFNPNAVSEAGAKGIAQIIPATARDLGIAGREFSAYTSIDAGIRYMRQLTDRYGDQRLALVAYNGGGGAIDSVERALGKNDITVGDFMNEMMDRRHERGTHVRSAWHVETFNYLRKIDSTFWSESKRNLGIERMFAAGMSGIAAETVTADANTARPGTLTLG